MAVRYLTEMATSRADAIEECFHQAKKFIEHFHKVVKGGVDDRDFSHHCDEMEAYWGDVKNIKLKPSAKLIAGSQLSDWFFTKGETVEDVIEEPYQDIYERLIVEMQYDRNKSIEEIFREILGNGQRSDTVHELKDWKELGL